MKKNVGNFVKWIATLAAFMLNIQTGLIIGWSSPNIAWLSSDRSPIPMTPSEISWMISITSLGAPVGSILGSISVEYLGSRKTVLVSYLTAATSWTCLLFANSVRWLYVARFISSLPSSMLFCCFSLYLSEITDQTIRGTLISLAATGMALGWFLGTIAETYLPKNMSNPIYLSEALLGIAIICWLKDTPYILAKNGDVEGAKRSIEFYSTNANVNEELETIQLFVKKSEGTRDKFQKLRAPSVRKSILIVCVLFGLPYISGGAVLVAYMEVILNKARVDIIKPAECVICIVIVMIVASFSTFMLTDKVGRKILLIASTIGTTAALGSVGLHFYLLQLGFDAVSLQWLPIIAIIMYFIFHAIGYGCVPSTLLSELFPENIKSLAACAATLSSSLGTFLAAKAYQPLVDSFGISCTFWIFATVAATGIPCVLFLLIETKGKTFQQIQSELIKR